MSMMINRNNLRVDKFGRVNMMYKDVSDFKYLVGYNINDIINFEDGTVELSDSGAMILPRHYYIFVGIRDGEVQLKPYEYTPYRIVVSTQDDIIINVESIG